MAYSRAARSQLKNVTAREIINALKKDGWTEQVTRQATRSFRKVENGESKYITIHYHSRKTYNVGFLEKLLIGRAKWSEDDLKRLKLIR